MNTRSVLVVGASGLVGGHLLKVLLADDTYSRVTVLTRKPLGFEHPKLRSALSTSTSWSNTKT